MIPRGLVLFQEEPESLSLCSHRSESKIINFIVDKSDRTHFI